MYDAANYYLVSAASSFVASAAVLDLTPSEEAAIPVVPSLCLNDDHFNILNIFFYRLDYVLFTRYFSSNRVGHIARKTHREYCLTYAGVDVAVRPNRDQEVSKKKKNNKEKSQL